MKGHVVWTRSVEDDHNYNVFHVLQYTFRVVLCNGVTTVYEHLQPLPDLYELIQTRESIPTQFLKNESKRVD